MPPAAPLRPFATADVAAPTAVEASDFDRHAIQERRVPEAVLMENAGRQSALLIQHLYPSGLVTALVGSGNNGGDALVCLRALASWGRAVRGVVVGDRREANGLLHDWPLELRRWQGDHDELHSLLAGSAVVVDGLLGTGIRGAPRERETLAIEVLTSLSSAVVALDTPSGVDGSTGSVPGSAVSADVTVAFGWPKLGTLLHPGRVRAGRLVAVEIGFPPVGTGAWARLITPAWAHERLPARGAAAHKNAVGSLCVVAGWTMPGAAVLAIRSAFRSGVGYVRWVGPTGSRDAVLSSCPEAVHVDPESPEELATAIESSDALAVGPGLGTSRSANAVLSEVIATRGQRPLVLDADALNLLVSGGTQWPSVEAPYVVTPHPGEMGRLIGQETSAVQAERVQAAQALAGARGCVTVLKGTPTLVAAPDGSLLIATQGTSDLAVAGMGDALTGSVGAFLAQGLEAVEAAGVGLHVTGRAARLAGRGRSLTPSDVIEHVPAALRERGPGETDLPFPFVIFDDDPPR